MHLGPYLPVAGGIPSNQNLIQKEIKEKKQVFDKNLALGFYFFAANVEHLSRE